MITVDVAVHHYAMAHWDGTELGYAQYVDGEPLGDGGIALRNAVLGDGGIALRNAILGDTRVIIEIPKIYDAQRQKGDQRDIRDLALAAGALAVTARFARGVLGERVPTELIEPREWKGTVDKKVMLARIYEKLSEAELRAIDLTEKALASGMKTGRGPGADVLDAIGIGLWKLGRLNRGRVR